VGAADALQGREQENPVAIPRRERRRRRLSPTSGATSSATSSAKTEGATSVSVEVAHGPPSPTCSPADVRAARRAARPDRLPRSGACCNLTGEPADPQHEHPAGPQFSPSRPDRLVMAPSICPGMTSA
jgi:hypothetical protein